MNSGLLLQGERDILRMQRNAVELAGDDTGQTAGGGVGSFTKDENPTDRRKKFHPLTFYGFALCFAATCVATLYHDALGRPLLPAPAGRS